MINPTLESKKMLEIPNASNQTYATYSDRAQLKPNLTRRGVIHYLWLVEHHKQLCESEKIRLELFRRIFMKQETCRFSEIEAFLKSGFVTIA